MKQLTSILGVSLLISLLILVVIGHAQRHVPMPHSLRIDEEYYTVELADERDMPGLEGTTNTATHAIKISKGLCLAEEQDSLWHEVHHAHFAAGVDQDKSTFTIHKAIEVFTPFELHVMKDNPELVRYLIQ